MGNLYIIHDDYAEIVVDSKTYGVFNVKIDLDDVERCKQYTWCVSACWNKDKNKFRHYYISSGKVGMMHRFIINAKKGMVVDHTNRDTTDNRKENLRECTHQQNNMNRERISKCKSGHKGVFWNEYLKTPKWTAYIMINKKHKTIGYYDKLEDAVAARAKVEIELFGEFAREEVKEQFVNK